jgi:hypothetical protein
MLHLVFKAKHPVVDPSLADEEASTVNPDTRKKAKRIIRVNKNMIDSFFNVS